MPNRIIKESIHTSDKVNAMTDFQFRLWVSLIAYVDDYGRGDARPAIIKGSCFPLRERLTLKEIDAALTGLAGIGCVVLYAVDGRPYLCFPNWEKHQSIRNKRSKFPAPPDNLQAIEINCNQLNANVPVIQSNPIQIQSESESEGEARKRAKTAPTLEEVIAYAKERNSPVDPKAFYDYFSAGNWKDAKGQSVRSWKQKFLTWEKYEPSKKTPKGFPSMDYGDPSAEIERMKKMLKHMEGKPK